MSVLHIRVRRDTPESGEFDWALPDRGGALRESGSATLGAGGPQGPCHVVLAADLVLLEKLAVPAAQRRRVGAGLRFLAEDAALPDPERLHVAAESSPGKDALAVAIVDKQWFKDLLARLEQGGLAPRSVVPETLLPPLAPGTWCVVCDGRESFVRTGELDGFPLDSTRSGDVPVALRLALAHGAPERIVLRAAPGAALPDARRWSTVLAVPVEVGEPWHWGAVPARTGLELLQREFAPRGAERSWRAGLRRPALLAAALLVLASCGLAGDWWAKAREQRALRAQLNAIYAETFGESAVIVDAPLQMQRALAELRSASGEASPADFLPLLGRLSAQLLDPARQRIDSMAYERGTLRVVLRPREQQQLSALRAELEAKLPVSGLDVRIEPAESHGTPGLSLSASASGGKWAGARP